MIAELERLHSHLLWAGVAAELVGFQTVFMHVFRLRERVMDLLEQISGNRVNYSMNRIGGVNRDITEPAKVLEGVAEIRRVLTESIIPVFTTDATVQARCRGVGVLTRSDAIALGAVGPLARASGLDMDLRRDNPYLAYDRLKFTVPVQQAGDVLARVVVRALEMLESCTILEQAIEGMPPGPLHTGRCLFGSRGRSDCTNGSAARRGLLLRGIGWQRHCGAAENPDADLPEYSHRSSHGSRQRIRGCSR